MVSVIVPFNDSMMVSYKLSADTIIRPIAISWHYIHGLFIHDRLLSSTEYSELKPMVSLRLSCILFCQHTLSIQWWIDDHARLVLCSASAGQPACCEYNDYLNSGDSGAQPTCGLPMHTCQPKEGLGQSRVNNIVICCYNIYSGMCYGLCVQY